MPRSVQRQQLDMLANSLGYVIKGRTKDPRYSLRRAKKWGPLEVIWCEDLDHVEEVLMDKFKELNGS